jgi:hypothetical protein
MEEQFGRHYFKKVQDVFGISDDLYEKYVNDEILKDAVLVDLLRIRENDFNWIVKSCLGGPGTVLNAFVIYSLIRHFDLKKVIETGVSGGFFTTFLLSALAKNGNDCYLDSVEFSSDLEHIGHLIPASIKANNVNWKLHTGIDSLLWFEQLKNDGKTVDADLYCHDSLHTMSHMTKELLWFKKCEKEKFFVYVDDQNSDDFWERSKKIKLFNKKQYAIITISGNDFQPAGHLGGFLRYDYLHNV